LIEGETTIENGTTLTIEAGVHVIWQNNSSSMYVDGQILAQGTETDSIIFTAAIPLNGWKGVKFDSTLVTNDTSKFEYCVFEYAIAYGPYPENAGGAIGALQFGKIIIDHCYFHDNKALQVSGEDPSGGAIALWASSPVIMNSTFINNISYAGGAIICWKESHAKIENNLFTSNTAIFGGAIFCHESDPMIKHNLFYDNSAGLGGGAIDLWINCSPSIINNTIANNESNDKGGGIILYQGCNPMIQNTILWGNAADTGNQVYIHTDDCIPAFFYCDIQGGQAGFGGVPHTGDYKQCFDEDPLFGLDYSLTWMNEPIPDSTKSPCIDTGDPTMFDPDGTRCDVGAFYYHQDSVGISDLLPKNKLTWIHCYPNPTNGKSDIRYQISEVRNIALTVYGVCGREMVVLVDEAQAAGEYIINFDTSALPEGLYIIRLQAGDESAVGKLLVVH
ncbi:MAG: T9SS type A sorting domain-containing protein, partial [Bacteroidetes bacterium]|nr:T9SS type A sorting domain-containing protein [Bacteroidota bacterium]